MAKFSPRGFNDLWAAVLFLVHAAIVLGWIGYAAQSGKFGVVQEAAKSDKVASLLQGKVVAASSPQDMAHFAITLALISLVLAVVWGGIWLFLLQSFPVQVVYISLWAWVGICILLAMLSFISGDIFGGIILFGMALLFALMIHCCRDRIAFTAKCLRAVSTIYQKQPGIFMVCLGVVLMQVIWVFLMVLAFIPLVFTSNDPDGAGGGGAAVFLIFFSFFWGSQVISNILHMTCAGVLGRWYFNQEVEQAVSKSFGQACTSYFGTICFGSLLIAIIQTMKTMLEQAKSQGEQSGNGAAAIGAMIAICLLDCIESLVRLFNTFAFIVTAIYSLPFCDAGKKVIDIWARGNCEVLCSYNFASIVCFLGNLFGAVLVAGACAIAAALLGLNGGYIFTVAIMALLGSFCILMVVSRIVESGCDTLFLCYAEEPRKLRDTTPELASIFSEHAGISGRPQRRYGRY